MQSCQGPTFAKQPLDSCIEAVAHEKHLSQPLPQSRKPFDLRWVAQIRDMTNKRSVSIDDNEIFHLPPYLAPSLEAPTGG